MLHEKRVFNVRRVETAEELADLLTRQVWTLCAGFELDGLLFLNDSLSEDGAQEYAVVRGRQQIESVTFGWSTPARALETIRGLLAGTNDVDLGPAAVRVERSRHRCRFCV